MDSQEKEIVATQTETEEIEIEMIGTQGQEIHHLIEGGLLDLQISKPTEGKKERDTIQVLDLIDLIAKEIQAQMNGVAIGKSNLSSRRRKLMMNLILVLQVSWLLLVIARMGWH